MAVVPSLLPERVVDMNDIDIEEGQRLAPVRCRGCGVSIHPATHVVLGNAWADDDGVFACASALTAHEPRPPSLQQRPDGPGDVESTRVD